jgi:hypothetical protein
MWTVDVSAGVEVTMETHPIELRTKERAIVAALALHHPKPARAAELAPLIWGDDIPATATKSIHNHVSRLRRSAPDLVMTADEGYRLAEGTTIENNGSSSSYSDLADQPQVALARARDRRRALQRDDDEFVAELHASSTDELAVRAALLVDRAPHRFERWWWLAVVSARLGRRRDALDVIRRCREWHGGAATPASTQQALNRLEAAIIDDDVFIDSPAALAPQSLGGPAAGAAPSVETGPGERALGTIDPMGTIEAVAAHIDRSAGSTWLRAPAGGGKTTAIRTIVEHLSPMGWNCFVASCSPIEPNPLQPLAELTELLNDRSGTVDGLVQSERRSSGGAPGEHVAALISRLVAPERRRTLLIVDDAHDADETTQRYLGQLAVAVDAAGPHVALLLATRRRVDGIRSVAHSLELSAWSADAVTQYLQSYLTPGKWADGAVEWVARRSGGNPLYVRELTIDVLRAHTRQQVDAPFVPPVELDEATSSSYRIEQLRPDVRAVLDTAAMIGDVFRRDDLLRLGRGVPQALALAEASGLIRADRGDRCRFVHQTFRQTLLDALSDGEQVALAQRIAATIGASPDRDDRLAELARFARSASTRDPERAIVTTLDAAEHARDQLRFEEALSLCGLALSLIEDHEGRSVRWCAATVMAGGMGIDTGAPEAVPMLVDAALRAVELEAPDIVGEAVWYLCALGPSTQVGRIHEVTAELLDYALERVTTPAIRARVCAGGSFSTALADDPATSRELYAEADHISARLGEPTVRADVLLRAYTPLSELDDVPRRRLIAAELRELAERFDRVEYLYEAHRLDFADAIQWGTSDPRSSMEQIEAIARRMAQRGRNWSLVSYRVTIALLDGDLEEAERQADVLLTDEVTVGDALRTSTYGAHLIAIRMAQGRTAELDPLVASLVESQPELTIWRAIRALTSAEADPPAAIAAFDSVFVADGHQLPLNYSLVPGLVAAAEGTIRFADRKRQQIMLGHLTPFADRWAFFNVGTVGPVDLTLARLHRSLGDRDAALRCAVRGLRSAANVVAPMFAALCGAVIDDISAAPAVGRR